MPVRSNADGLNGNKRPRSPSQANAEERPEKRSFDMPGPSDTDDLVEGPSFSHRDTDTFVQHSQATEKLNRVLERRWGGSTSEPLEGAEVSSSDDEIEQNDENTR